MGSLLAAAVHAANIHGIKSGPPAREAFGKYPGIGKFCADAGYRKPSGEAARDGLDLGVDIAGKIKPHGWEKLPWGWAVGRALSWLGHSRRLAKGFEIAISPAIAMVRISHLHTLLKRWQLIQLAVEYRF